jgi:hypothetical protein
MLAHIEAGVSEGLVHNREPDLDQSQMIGEPGTEIP